MDNFELKRGTHVFTMFLTTCYGRLSLIDLIPSPFEARALNRRSDVPTRTRFCFFLFFAAAGAAAKKCTKQRGDNTRRNEAFFCGRGVAAKKCTKQSLPYAENEKIYVRDNQKFSRPKLKPRG